LTCWYQAPFALVWCRKREDLTVLGAAFGIGRATAYRYRDEVLAVLATRAPDLPDALDRVRHEGWSHVILNGKVDLGNWFWPQWGNLGSIGGRNTRAQRCCNHRVSPEPS
jgi:NAD(P)-dependent dehydrogenase (short-subunit alcohol dehydrogenase family)